MREECEPLDLIVKDSHDLNDPVRQALIPPLQQMVKERGLWATHLGPQLGGPGYGQVKLALLNEILGRSECAPIVFGCQAPDSGNGEILAHYGTPELKERYLEPLLDNEIVSCFSMTEPQGGADPKVFTTTAVLDGDEWVINGEKWFSSYASMASFLIVMAVTDPGRPARTSAFDVRRARRHAGHQHPAQRRARLRAARRRHARLRPLRGRARARRPHARTARRRVRRRPDPPRRRPHPPRHAHRRAGAALFDMMCERAVSRYTQGEMLANKQLVQEMIADSWIEIEPFRLLVLQTAWKIDQYNDYKGVRADISAVKATMPKVLHDVSARALQIHGSLGVTHEMPFVEYLV